MNLDPQQQAAVLTDSLQVLCLAGAGSGKTRVLVERIAHLIEDRKVSPHEIMAVSFTRKASGELQDRLQRRIGVEAKKIKCGTIHSIALRYLKQFGDLIGWRAKHLTVYSEFEEEYLLRECAIDLGIYKNKTWKPSRKDVQAAFDRYYQEGVIPEEEDPCRRIFDELISRCKENNSLTYGGLLMGMRTLLFPISQYLHLQHIFVDEVQDLDLLQHQIFKELAERSGASLFYVGDLDQSIYSWRGAVPEYLIEHQKAFEIFKIETNYRSDPAIVVAANKLISHNQKRIDRTMKPSRLEQKPEAVADYREMDSDGTARELTAVYDSGLYKDGDVAILGRNHFLLKKLSLVLDNVNFPYTYVGRAHELMDSLVFRQVHAFLKLLVNPYDNFSFLLIRELLGLSREQYNEIRLKATQNSDSHFDAYRDTSGNELNAFDEFFWGELTDFGDHIDYLCQTLDKAGVPEEELMPVYDFISEWVKKDPSAPIPVYLEWLACYDLQDEIKENDDKLKLMTIHAAKGLEWPCVILIGCNEGILPSKQSIENDDVESERRLFYVAMTRAKDSLILAVRPERKEDARGKVHENPVSRFIAEMKGGE